MTLTTWDGSASTNWATDANWDTGTAPTTNDDVIIPDTSSLNNPTLVTAGANVTVNSLFMAANATLVGGGYIVIVTGEADGSGATTDGYAVDIDGIISGELDIELRTAATTSIDLNASSGSVWDLKINHASCVAQLDAGFTCGNLVIVAGELATGGHALTVTRLTTIGTGSGEDVATLTCAASTISLGSTLTSGYAVIVEIGGTFVGGSGAHTMGSFKVGANNANAKATFTTGVTTINAKSNDSNKAIRIAGPNAGFDDGNGTVTFTYAGAIAIQTSTKPFYNVIVNHASCDITLIDALTVANNLTITAGELDTTGSNFALTVTEDVSVTGTLTGNASAISVKTLTIASGGTYSATSGTTTITGAVGSNYAINNGGTFTHNSGTIDFTGSVQQQTNDGLVLHNVICNNSHSNGLIYRNNTMNDLTVNASKNMSYYSGGGAITVNGDATISGHFNKNGSASGSGAYSFGSLTILSGGTYYATSGTTTVTGEKSATGFAMHNAGTFTHNNGTVTFNDNASHIGVNTFYNLIIECGSSSGYIQARAISGSTITVANDFTIKEGRFNFETVGNTFTVTRNTLIESGGVYSYGTGETADPDRATGAHNHGSLTIASGGTFNATTGTTTLTSETSGGYTWRNDGGTFTPNSGTVTTNSSVDTKIKENTFYNLILNQSTSGKFVYWEDTSGNTCTVANDLTITTGRLRGLVASDTVTVTGDVSVAANGTFNHSSVWTGAVNHGSLTIASGGTYNATTGTTTILNETGGYAWKNDETDGTGFVHNNGTVHVDFQTGGGTGDTKVQELTWGHVKWTGDEASHEIHFIPQTGSTVTIAKDLTVHEGYCRPYSFSLANWIVTEDVLIESGGTLGPQSHTGDYSFGSLTIASGGIYQATQGTTTITGKTSGLALDNAGTFTHNNGTMKFTDNDYVTVKNNIFYNVILNTTGGTYAVLFQDTSGDNVTILNNLEIIRGDFELSTAGDTLDIYGKTILNSGTGNTGARFNNDKDQTGTITHHGLVEIISGTYHVEDGGTVNMAGIRNVGGLVD